MSTATRIGAAASAKIDSATCFVIDPDSTVAEVIAGTIELAVAAQLDEPGDDEEAILAVIAADRGEPVDALLATRQALAERVRAAVDETIAAWSAEQAAADAGRPTALCQWCDREVRWSHADAGFVHVASGKSECGA